MIYLAQTDTTAGFLSKDFRAINALKKRALNTPCLICVAEFGTLKSFVRVPQPFKNKVRKAKKTSFLYPNSKALRVVKDLRHSEFIKKHTWLYSSSANEHKHTFNEAWARTQADVIVDEKLFEGPASQLFKLGKNRLKKLR